MIIREIFAKLGLQVDKQGFENAEKNFKNVLGGLASLGAGIAVFAGTVRAAMASIERGSRLNDLNAQTGIAVDKLQGLQHAAEQTGGSLEGAVQALKFLAKNSFEAANGSEEMQKAFAQAGITVRDAAGKMKAPEVLMQELGNRLREMPDAGQRTFLAMKLMGRAGADLIPTLTDADMTLQEFLADSKELGQLSKEETKLRDKAGDELGRLKKAWTVLLDKALTPLIKAAVPVIQFFVDLVVHFRKTYEWSEQFRAAVKMLGIGITAAAVVMAAAGLSMASAWLLSLAPLLAIGAAITGILLLAEDLHLYFTDPKASTVTGRLVENFNKLWGTITEDPKQFFIDLWTWIVTGFQTAIDTVSGMVKAKFPKFSSPLGAPSFQALDPTNVNPLSTLFGSMPLVDPNNPFLKIMEKVRDFGFSPAMSQQIAGGATTNNATNNINITVNPPPGTSPKEIAHETLSAAKSAIGQR